MDVDLSEFIGAGSAHKAARQWVVISGPPLEGSDVPSDHIPFGAFDSAGRKDKAVSVPSAAQLKSERGGDVTDQ
jgi:hypothetical protein